MLIAFVYSRVRLLLDVADVRLRVRDPEAELLLLRHQLRCLSGGRCRSDQDADCSTQGQCPHGAADWFDSARVPGLDSDPEPSPSRARSGGVVRALQLGPNALEMATIQDQNPVQAL